MVTCFERISKYPDAILPIRKTKDSAGYDFYVAEDTIIPPISELTTNIINEVLAGGYSIPLGLDQMSDITKAAYARPTLVPTGIKVKLPSDSYLQLSVRSSSPYKYLLGLANGVGIIDADYYNNPDNEGHIFFQIINWSPYPIFLKKGECLGQGIVLPYQVAKCDKVQEVRKGGFGSTDA